MQLHSKPGTHTYRHTACHTPRHTPIYFVTHLETHPPPPPAIYTSLPAASLTHHHLPPYIHLYPPKASHPPPPPATYRSLPAATSPRPHTFTGLIRHTAQVRIHKYTSYAPHVHTGYSQVYIICTACTLWVFTSIHHMHRMYTLGIHKYTHRMY